MDFEYELDVNVPQEYAFERFTNIQEISSALPANIVLRPEKGAYELSQGSVWVVKAQRSGRNFVIRNKVEKNTYPSQVVFDSSSNRIESKIDISFVPTGPEACKITTNFDITPKGLLGRILIQSMKASKKRILSAMDTGAERLKLTLEEDYRKG